MRIFYDRLSSAFWIALVSLLVLLAIYVSIGRLLMASLDDYREPLLQELNVRLPFTVEADALEGSWRSFSPYVVLRGLRLSFPEQDVPPLAFSEGRIRVNVLNTLLTGDLQVHKVELTALKLRGELDGEGRFQLTGFGGGGGTGTQWLKDFFLNIESLVLRDNQLNLGLPDGERRDLTLNLELERDSSSRKLQAELRSTAGTLITVLAEGVGDPFEPEEFDGRGYARVQTSSLGAMQSLMPPPTPLQVDGEGEVQLWFDLEEGQPEFEIVLDARDLSLAGTRGDWEVPLDHLALKAQVIQEKSRWKLLASDVLVARDDAEFILPTVHFDAWEDSLRLRFPELELVNVMELVNEMQSVPAGLLEALNTLAPKGRLPALEVSLLDLAQPSKSWQIRATFDDVEVSPYRGAPGVTGASGFADITPQGGRFIIDSDQASLAFPSIYREPLAFDELSGELGLSWDSESVVLSSDLITATGEEGTARALFGLKLPLEESPVGPEMDLMVGLRDFDPVYRDKYLPYTLPDTLLDWLDRSIVRGRIEAGAFLYRGSLRPGLNAARTVQLAFNVAEAELDYDPRWPAATIENGIVFIDDTNISVWAGKAGVYESKADDVSVETVVGADGAPQLALRASVSGPAADGLRILNDTALADVLGSTFADWRAVGQLNTDLDLDLVLREGAPPKVDALVELGDVDLTISPGNLQLENVSGGFGYSTTTGFSARELGGTLWGRGVDASITQRHANGERYEAGSSEVRINFSGSAEVEDVQEWLGLEFLALAEGVAAVDGAIVLAPGAPATLEIGSELLGVALDLPEPWRKPPDVPRALGISYPLGADGGPFTMRLGQDLALAIGLGGDTFGGALAINATPADIEQGVFRVTGEAPFIEADQWIQFVTNYFVPAGTGAEPKPEVPEATAEGEPVAAAAPRVVVDSLRAQILRVLGQTLEATTFSVDIGPQYWQVELANDWLRGEGALAQAGGQSRVTVDYLDLDRLPELLPATETDSEEAKIAETEATDAESSDEPANALARLDLPEVRVRLLNLHQGERRLGDLRFTLVSGDERINFDNIGGELAGLRFLEGGTNWLGWQQGEAESTELSLQLAFDNIGDTLEYFGYLRTMETRDGKLSLDFTWPGSPNQMALAEGEGELLIDFGRGNFLAVPAGASNALRVVSILNLFDIVRRLSLTHMFESGIPFDSVKGTVEVADGRITVPALSVKGGSSFKFSGVSDIADQTLSGELVATLPLSNNLPWIAALAANLPVAAGVFVISKLFDKQMQRLSSAVYSIEGTWDEPDVSFDRVFDDRSKGVPKEQSAKGGKGAEPEVAPQTDVEQEDVAADVEQPGTALEAPPEAAPQSPVP